MEIDFTKKILAANENKTLNKPFRTPKGPKKFSVYVKNEKGNVVKVNFGDPNMEIKRDDPDRRRNFRARHNCSNPGPKTKARYWSCKMWEAGKSVTDYTKGCADWDGVSLADHDELLTIDPELAFVEEEINDPEEDDCGCDGCGCKKAQAAHDDQESGMILSQISKSIDQLTELKSMINAMPEGADFEGWVQSKFTKIADYVNSVHSYIKYYESDDEMEASFNYDMTSEEYDEVMTIEDIISAARPGPKSAAQTPAKPSERRKGSGKNKPGSAGSKGGKINFSESVITSLKEKVKKHNAKYSKKVTLGQLKKVYRRGAGAFSSSHRPGMSRGGWAMARVNMFLKMKRGGKVKDSYRKADGDI